MEMHLIRLSSVLRACAIILIVICSKVSASATYDRKDYGSWADQNRDCISTRHQLLIELSTGPIRMNDKGCRVVSGRWYDPYTGTIFYKAADIDIDHVVPVFAAHQRGSHAWPKSLKVQFYNDPANLIPVSKRANRQKGSKGPSQWLPSNQPYQCEYVLRYARVLQKYQLTTEKDRATLMRIRNQVCG